MALTGVKPGWTSLDMGGGPGYSTEPTAPTTGPTDKVYGQNPPEIIDWARAVYEEREVTCDEERDPLMRGYEDPLPWRETANPRRGLGRLGVNLVASIWR